MTTDQPPSWEGPPGPQGEEPRTNIPLLRAEDASEDLDVIRTWHEAVSDALLPVVPHDLFALWLYSQAGQPVLVGPEALAEDNLIIPRPSPYLDPRQLKVLEEIVRDAGYGSVMCLGIRHGGADVGLILMADLRPGRYGELQEATVVGATRAMAPVIGRIVRLWPLSEAPEGVEIPSRPSRPSEQKTHDAGRLAALYLGLGQASTGAGTPRDFTLALSFALKPVLPHDYIELLIPDASGDQHYRLGAHGLGPLWTDPALVVPATVLDFGTLFGDSGLLLVRDAESDPRRPAALAHGIREPEEEPGSMIGVRLRVLERTVAYLLLGSPGQDFYQEEDLHLLDQVGALIAARVDSFVLVWHQQVLRSNLNVLRHIPMHLNKIAEILAASPLLGEGTRLFERRAAELLPVDRVEFALRLGDDARVAIIRPGETTPLADHPQSPIAGTQVGQVIAGELPYLLTEEDVGRGPVSVLVVPLRVAGTVIGALAMTAGAAGTFSRTDVTVAQQLADLAAPHFEIQRRAALAQPAFMPGWKRTPRF